MEERSEQAPAAAEGPAADATPAEAADSVAPAAETVEDAAQTAEEKAPPAEEVPVEAGAPAAEAEAPAAGEGEAPAAAPESRAPAPTEAKKGKKLTGKIVQIGENGVFVNFGGREEGVLELKEIQDDKGANTKAVGDEVRATVVSVEGGVKLTLKGKRPGNLPALLDARAAGTPVDGKVTGVNKGGLVVRTMGVRAFCPFSQIDRHYIDNPEQYVGKRLTFRVSSADEKGRNVILSRRSILEEEAKEKAAVVRKDLSEGAELSGTVARIRPFGAFVDLGGIDGMVHVSEISHGRIGHPSEVLTVGQEVRVRIVKLEGLGGATERISLSMKQLEADPWEATAGSLSSGDKVTGKIVRVVDFGAFLEIAPGVDGLIHVSALAAGRVDHPSDIVKPGDELEAWVVQVDPDKRRISLSLVEPGAQRAAPERAPRGRRPPRDRAPKVHRSSDDGKDKLTSMGEAFERLRERMQGD